MSDEQGIQIEGDVSGGSVNIGGTTIVQGNMVVYQYTPPPSTNPMRDHVFISYSRHNTAFVERLIADLKRQNLSVWMDHNNRKPGTKIWDAEIRQVVRDSFAVLFIASPESAQSDYVYSELALAELYQREIILIWASGESWIDSVPLGMSPAQHVDARGDNYTRALERLSVWLDELQRGNSTPAHPVRYQASEMLTAPNPYKALNAFKEADQRVFYGRTQLVETWIEMLKSSPFLPIVGASGSGKSSLMMAGIIPRLKGGALPGSEMWRFVEPFVPGSHPRETLAVKLARLQERPDVPKMIETLSSPRGLILAGKLLVKEHEGRIVIPIDQFEEVYTQAITEDEQRGFLQLLMNALIDPDSRIIVLLTLRADFYDRPLNEPGFGELLAKSQQSARAMNPDELREAIESPARAVGAIFDDGLVGDLLYEARDQAGALPLLQYTLFELYELREGRYLTGAAYRHIGGIHGALTKRADEVYNSLGDYGKKLAQRLFLRLVDIDVGGQSGAIRRRVGRDEIRLKNNDAQTEQNYVLQEFVSVRLLTADKDTVEVSHEAIIRAWGRLNEWLKEARDDVLIMKRIAVDAREWASKGQDTAFVYSERRLIEAIDWASRNTPSHVENEFIQAGTQKAERLKQQEYERQIRELGQEHRNQRLAHIITVGAVIFAIVGFGLSFYALRQGALAESARQDAVNQAMAATMAQGEAEIQAQIAVDAQSTAYVDRNMMYAHSLALNARSFVGTNEALALALAAEAATIANQPDLIGSKIVSDTLNDVLRQGVIFKETDVEQKIRFPLNPNHLMVDNHQKPDVLVNLGDHLYMTELTGEVVGAFDIRAGYIGILYENDDDSANDNLLHYLKIIDVSDGHTVSEIADISDYALSPEEDLLLVARNQGISVFDTNNFQIQRTIVNPAGMYAVSSVRGIGPGYFGGFLKDHYLVVVYSVCESLRTDNPECLANAQTRIINLIDGSTALQLDSIVTGISSFGDSDYIAVNYNNNSEMYARDSEIRNLNDSDYIMSLNGSLANYAGSIDLSIDNSQYFTLIYHSEPVRSEIWRIGETTPVVSVLENIQGRTHFLPSTNRLLYPVGETLVLYDVDKANVVMVLEGVRNIWRWDTEGRYFWITYTDRLQGTTLWDMETVQILYQTGTANTTLSNTQTMAGWSNHNIWVIDAQQQLIIWTLEPFEKHITAKPANEITFADSGAVPEFYALNYQDTTAAIWQIDALSPLVELPKTVKTIQLDATYFVILYTDGQGEIRLRASGGLVATLDDISSESTIQIIGNALLVTSKTDLGLYSLITGNRLYTFIPNSQIVNQLLNHSLMYSTPQNHIILLNLNLLLAMDQTPGELSDQVKRACKALAYIQFDLDQLTPYLFGEPQACVG